MLQLVMLLTLGQIEAPTIIAKCDDKHYRHSEGSATRLADGTLLLVWSRFDGHKDRCGTLGDNGPATLVLSESSDDGKTWSEPRPLPVGTATVNIMQAAFVPVKKGLTLAFSVRMREGHTSTKFAIDSSDGGKTWSPRRELYSAGGPNDRALRLSTGRILIPSHRVTAKMIGKTKVTDVLVARSDDEGATWSLSAPLAYAPHAMESKENDPAPVRVHEPAVAECADGTLLMLARSQTGVLYESRSQDAGVTWSRLERTKLPAFAAPPYLKKLQDGRIVLLWNPIVGKGAIQKADDALKTLSPFPLGPRQRLAMTVTGDGGRTWSNPRVVQEDGKFGYCYPWTLENADGTLSIFCSRTPFTIYPCDLVQLPRIKP